LTESDHDEPIDQWREPPHDARYPHVLSLLSLSVPGLDRDLRLLS